MERDHSFLQKHWTFPYLALLVAAIVAYLPVSFMIFSLKNDIIVLEYPIKYYISECVRHGRSPFWFNSWAMGFPLDTAISWNAFNPLHLIPGLLFHYNIYILHLEFVGYIFIAGCSMYYFLRKHIIVNQTLAMLLATCYMLSGFNVGSSQWLFYITASAYIPLVISTLLDLIKYPAWKTSLRFVISFYCMLTGVYAAFSVITTYILGIVLILYFYRSLMIRKQPIAETFRYLLLSCVVIAIISAPVLLHTFEMLAYMSRGTAINRNTGFFNSNSLHLEALLSLLLPFASVKMHPFHSEGTMMDLYGGLFPLLSLSYCLRKSVLEKNKLAFLCLLASLFFLAAAFGPFTPIRDWLNFLPGFSRFRNAGLIRLYFLFFLITFVGCALRNHTLEKLLHDASFRKHFRLTVCVLLAFFLVWMCFSGSQQMVSLFQKTKFQAIPQAITKQDTYFISSIIQTLLLLSLFFALTIRGRNFFPGLIAIDVMLNTLICTPFFTVSSYSVSNTNSILKDVQGFPVQHSIISTVPTAIREGNAVWYNTNVYKKLVSSNRSYWGALFFKSFTPPDSAENDFYNHQLFYTASSGSSLTITSQFPDEVAAHISGGDSTRVFILQNFYPAWHAYFNHKPVSISKTQTGQMSILVKGRGDLQLYYERPFLAPFVIISDATIITLVAFGFFAKLISKRKKLLRSDSF